MRTKKNVFEPRKETDAKNFINIFCKKKKIMIIITKIYNKSLK